MKTFYYLGKRLNGKVLKHKVLSDDGSVYVYSKAKDMHFYGAVVGKEYRYGEEETLPRNWFEHETGNVHENAERYQALCRLDLEQKKASNVEHSPNVKKHVDALRNACYGMTTNERAAFLAYLIREFMSWKK